MTPRAVAVLIVLLLSVISVPAAGAQTHDLAAADAVVAAINDSRSAAGLPPLAVNAELSDIARGWTSEMAAAADLRHNPSYGQQYSGEWVRMAENVGRATQARDVGRAVARLHEAFMASDGHRRNILGPYNQLGVGVLVDAGHTMWVTVNFLDGPVPEPVAPEGHHASDPQRHPAPPAGSGHFVRPR